MAGSPNYSLHFDIVKKGLGDKKGEPDRFKVLFFPANCVASMMKYLVASSSPTVFLTIRFMFSFQTIGVTLQSVFQE